MKIKTKKQKWRRVGRQFMADVIFLAILFVGLNMAFGLVVANESIGNIRARDLVIVLKFGFDINNNDMILVCDNECGLFRVVAKSGDLVWLDKNKLLINGEVVGEGKESVIEEFKGDKVLAIDSMGSVLVLSPKNIRGKIVSLLRVRGF